MSELSSVDRVVTGQHLLHELALLLFSKGAVPHIRIESVAQPLKAIEAELDRCNRAAHNVARRPLPAPLAGFEVE